MKRIAILSVSLLFAFTGIVYAASVNGQYDGHDIVKVKYEGVELQVDKVPGILYNGNTLVPLGMLRQAGFVVEWDGDTQTANVKPPESKPVESSNDVAKIAKEMKKHNVSYVRYETDGDGFNKLTYLFGDHIDNISKYENAFGEMMDRSIETDAKITEIVDAYDNVFWVGTDLLRKFYKDEITVEELSRYYNIEYNSIEPQPNTSNPVPSQPAPETPKTNLEQCKVIIEDYNVKWATLWTVNPEKLTENQKRAKELLLEYERDQALEKAGCN